MLDYLIYNARIIDPESETDFIGSLGLKDGKIDSIYQVSASLPNAMKKIDAQGGILVPGFIDVHAHSENSIPCAEKLLAMGVTTAVSGNCGWSTLDFDSFFKKYENGGYPVNQLEQAGHGYFRKKAGQIDINAPATPGQIEKMKSLIGEAFSAGACGLSFGLEYDPGTSVDELIELSRFTAEAGRFVSIHGRYTKQDDLDSLKEALDIAVITGVPLIYSHLVYIYLGEALKEALNIITEYRKKCSALWVDSGMYTAFTTIAASPSFDEIIFLNDESQMKRLSAASGKYTGQQMDREKYMEMRSSFPNEFFTYDPGHENDVFVAYSLPDVLVSTDCIDFIKGQGHPQGAATYPYFFRMLVKEKKQFSLLEAVKRCTLLPAIAVGLDNKGRISPGMDADLVVLDWDNLREHADFPGRGDPDAPPSGVKHVFVNGKLSVKDEKLLPYEYAGFSIKHC